MEAATDTWKYKKIMDDFMAAREWTDDLEIDTEEQTVTLVTGIDLNGQNGRLIVKANERTDMIDVLIYPGVKCKEAKLEQMALLMNEIHLRFAYGRFEVFPDGYIRWRHRVDFEGSVASGQSVEQIVGPGWNAVEAFADTISAVALTKQTAAQAIADRDEASNAKEQAQGEDEGPTEL